MNRTLIAVTVLLATSSITSFSPTAIASQASSNSQQVCADKDCTTEMRKLMRLARNGSGDAAAIVAMAYATGDGLEQDSKEALRYLRLGVRHRNAMATYLMSDWLRNGFMVEQDLAEADKLLDLAVAQKYSPAQYQKAMLLLQTEEEIAVAQAVTLLEAASEQKLVNAMYLLARFKHEGIATEQDLPGAAELYRYLVMSGHNESRPHMQSLMSELRQASTADAGQSADHSELLSRLQDADNVEVIQVVGSVNQTNTMLDGMVRRLNATGRYDNRSVGSRIRGVSCEQSGSNCGVIRADSSSGSISEALSGGK